MPSITPASTQVNTPAFKVSRHASTGAAHYYLAEPYASHLLEAICNTGLHNAAEIAVTNDGNDGLTVIIGGQHVRVTFTPVPMETFQDTHEADDTLPPEAEDASYARWSEGYLHDMDVEQVARVAFEAYYERPMTPTEDFEAFLASECGSVPSPRYATTGEFPRRAFANLDR